MLPLGRHSRFTRFEHSDLAIGEISKPHPSLRILREESDHLHPRWECKFSKLPGRRIKSGHVGTEIVRQPQTPGLFFNYYSVRAEIWCWWVVERHLSSFWIELTKPVPQDISKPDIILCVHLDASHKGRTGHRISLDQACFGINSVNRALRAICAPSIIVRIHGQVIASDVVGVELLRARIKSEGFLTAGGPNIAG